MLEVIYTSLLVGSLVLNGVTLAARTPLLHLVTPLREPSLVGRIMLLDLVVLPIVLVGAATLIGVDPATRAGLVIVAASSCGPIGMVLTRVVRGDVALGVSLVVGLGALNLLTVPILTRLLLPEGIAIPVASLLLSLLGLAVAPILAGRAFGLVAERRGASEALLARVLSTSARGANVLLAGAIATALAIEPTALLLLAGPILPVGIAAMLAVAVGARLVSTDPARRRTISVTVNARAVGLALTVVALHLGDAEGVRATVLAYGGLTQIVPVAVVLAAGWHRGTSPVSAPRPS